MRKRSNFWVATAPIAALAGCVPTVMAPTVAVTPGPGKSPAVFAADQTGCRAQVSQQLAPVIQAANNQVVGNALLGAAFGAGNMAAVGASNSAVGAGAGANAVAGGAATAQTAAVALQQQYDVAYGACMYAKGDDAPGYPPHPTYYAEPAEPAEPAPTHRARRRVAHKPAPAAATTAASGSGQSTASGFVVPAASVQSAGSGFVEPTPSAASSSSAQFAVPQPSH